MPPGTFCSLRLGTQNTRSKAKETALASEKPSFKSTSQQPTTAGQQAPKVDAYLNSLTRLTILADIQTNRTTTTSSKTDCCIHPNTAYLVHLVAVETHKCYIIIHEEDSSQRVITHRENRTQ